MSRATLRSKGQITLPAEIREALHVQDGDDIEFVYGEDGSIFIIGLKMIPADQAWFWTESWQQGEREASDDIAAGRTDTFHDSETFLKSLKRD